jgi:hypothetical protein
VREKSGGDGKKSKSCQKVWGRKVEENNNLYLLLSLFYFLHPRTRACHTRPRTRVRETRGAKSQKVRAGAIRGIHTFPSRIDQVGLRRDGVARLVRRSSTNEKRPRWGLVGESIADRYAVPGRANLPRSVFTKRLAAPLVVISLSTAE